jgi:hypothetical protein
MTTTIQSLQATQKAAETTLTRLNRREEELRLKLTRLGTQTAVIGAGAGAAKPTRITVTADHTAVDNSMVIVDMEASGATDVTVSLPANSSYPIAVVRRGTENTLTVDPGSGVTINGEATIILIGDQTSVQLRYDGLSNWEIT